MADSTFMNASVEEEGNIRQSYDIKDEKIYPYVLLDCIIDLDDSGFMQRQGIEVIRNGFMHRDLTVGTFHSELTDSNDEAIGVESKISFGVDENGVTAIGNVTVGNENAVITKSLRVFNFTNLFKHINVIDDAAYSVSLFTTEGYGSRTSSDESDGSGSYMQFGYEGVTHDFFHITRTDASVLYSSGTDADNSTRQQSVFMNSDYIHFYSHDDSGTNRYFNSLFVGDAKKLRKSTGVINSADSIPDYPNAGQIVSLFNPNIGVQLLNETANPLRVVGKSENKTVGSGNEKRITLYGPAVTLTFGESSNLGTNYWGLGSGNSISRNAEIRVAKVINVGNGTNSNPEAVHFVDFSTPIGVQDAIRGTNGTLAIYPWTYDGKVGRIDLGRDASITSTGRIYEYGDTIDIGSTYKGAGTNRNRLYMGKAEDMGEYIGSGMTIKKDTDVTVWRNSKAGIALTDTADTNRKNANLRVVGFGDVDNDAKYIYGPHISFMDGLKDKKGTDESFWGTEYIKTRFAKATGDSLKGIFFDIDSNLGLGGRDGKSTIFSRTDTLRLYNRNIDMITDNLTFIPYDENSSIMGITFKNKSVMNFMKPSNIMVDSFTFTPQIASRVSLKFNSPFTMHAPSDVQIGSGGDLAISSDGGFSVNSNGRICFNCDDIEASYKIGDFVHNGVFRNIGRISGKSLQIISTANGSNISSDTAGIVVKEGDVPEATTIFGSSQNGTLTVSSQDYTVFSESSKFSSLSQASQVYKIGEFDTGDSQRVKFNSVNVTVSRKSGAGITVYNSGLAGHVATAHLRENYKVEVFISNNSSATSPSGNDMVIGSKESGEMDTTQSTSGRWSGTKYFTYTLSGKEFISPATGKGGKFVKDMTVTKSKKYYIFAKITRLKCALDDSNDKVWDYVINFSVSGSGTIVGYNPSSSGQVGIVTNKGFFFGCDSKHWIRLEIKSNTGKFQYKTGDGDTVTVFSY